MKIVEYDRLAQRSCRGRAAERWLSRGLLGATYSPHTSNLVGEHTAIPLPPSMVHNVCQPFPQCLVCLSV